MKKISIFVIGLFIFFILNSMLISGEDEIRLPGELKKISDLGEKTQNLDKLIDQNSSYLAKEWTNVVSKNKYFSWIYKIPFNRIIGVEFSISWKFFIIFGISIALLIIFYSTLSVTFENPLLSFSLSFLVLLIIGNLRIFDRIFLKIEPYIDGAVNFILLLGAILIISYIFQMVTKIIKGYLKKQQDEKAKEAAMESKRKIESAEKGISAVKESYDDSS